MAAIRYSHPSRSVPTYYQRAVKRKLCAKFQLAERLVRVDTDRQTNRRMVKAKSTQLIALIKNIYTQACSRFRIRLIGIGKSCDF